MIFEFKGFKPVVHPSSFVHPQATVTGNVIIGKNVYIGPGCALRGDWGKIIIKDGCNVQENCTVHMFPGKDTILHEGAHIGHGAIIHGGIIGKNSLIGMNAVIMDEVEIGEECIVGALSFVKAKINHSKKKFDGRKSSSINKRSLRRNDWLENKRNQIIPAITKRLPRHT